MKGFDEWFEEEYGNYSGQSDKSKAKMYIAYEAGAQSRQAEVDELQKRIDAMQECMDDAIRLIDEGNYWDAKELLK